MSPCKGPEVSCKELWKCGGVRHQRADGLMLCPPSPPVPTLQLESGSDKTPLETTDSITAPFYYSLMEDTNIYFLLFLLVLLLFCEIAR